MLFSRKLLPEYPDAGKRSSLQRDGSRAESPCFRCGLYSETFDKYFFDTYQRNFNSFISIANIVRLNVSVIAKQPESEK